MKRMNGKRHGRRYASLIERIKANVKLEPKPVNCTHIEGPCWIWQGAQNARGYAYISIRRLCYTADGAVIGLRPRMKLVHRLVLQVFRGIDLMSVEVAMHLCSRKLCVSPLHIDAGSAKDNRDFYWDVERHQQEIKQ